MLVVVLKHQQFRHRGRGGWAGGIDLAYRAAAAAQVEVKHTPTTRGYTVNLGQSPTVSVSTPSERDSNPLSVIHW